jgi:hypothetical protein
LYNQFIATRFKGKKPGADSTAGGAGKVPRVGVNKSDLEAQGEQNGWTVGPLTMEQVRGMSSAALRWHEQFNAENLKAALELPAKLAEGKSIDKAWAAKRLWDDQTQATPEQSGAIWQALEKFKRSYPQFIQSRRENEVVLLWLKDRNMEVTFPSLVESFEANALAGKLWLNPNAINVGSESEVSGQDLCFMRSLSRSCMRRKPYASMSIRRLPTHKLPYHWFQRSVSETATYPIRKVRGDLPAHVGNRIQYAPN